MSSPLKSPNNLKPLTIVSHHHHHHPSAEQCDCLFCNDQGMSTPTPSSTLVVDDKKFFLPSEMWYEIFKYSDLYTLSVLMQCQRKWKSIYKMRGFKSKIQFLRMMTVELVVNQLNSSNASINKKYDVPQYAISGKCQISLNEQYLNKKHCEYNDLTKVIKKLDTLKDFILKEIKLWEEANGKVDCDQIFSVFKLMNDLFKPANTSPSGKRNEKRFAKDAFARVAIVGDHNMSKTTFFNTFRSQIENFESEANCLDDNVVLHSNNSNKMNNSSSYQIWDNYQSIDVTTMPPYFLRRINFLILIFDVSNLSSFFKLQTWVNQVVSGNLKIDTMPEFVLVGTKHDLLKPQDVEKYLENRNKHYQPFADTLGIPYIEVDSTNITHVDSIIHYSLSWTYFVHLLQNLSSTLKTQPDSKLYEKTSTPSFHLPQYRTFEARQLN